MNEIEKFFDTLASGWDKRSLTNLENIKKTLLKTPLNEGMKALDVACGTGVITKTINEVTKTDVDAIDLSSNMIEVAKAKYKDDSQLHFYKKDFLELNEKQYDFIIIFNAYPHFLNLEEFKKALLRNLKDDGYFLIFSDLSLDSLKVHHKNCMHVSRNIEDIDIEASFYLDSFNILKKESNKEGFLLLGQKK